MFGDLPSLFMTDGVPADLVRAGEPRLRRDGREHISVAAAPQHAEVRRPLLRWVANPLAS